MKTKRVYKRLSDEQVLVMIRAFHLGQATQTELAERYGTSSGHVCKLVHGEHRRELFLRVKSEFAGAKEST